MAKGIKVSGYKVAIWDDQLSSIISKLIKEKANVKAIAYPYYEEGNFEGFNLNDLDNMDLSTDEEDALCDAFGEDFGDRTLRDALFEHLFGTSDVEFYSGSVSSRGDGEIVFFLSNEQYEHYEKVRD